MELGRFELCLNVADLSASRRFYETLGFVAVRGEEDQGWLVLQNSSLTLALYQGHIGSNLLNFRGSDVFAVAAELSNQGIVFDRPAETEDDGSAGAIFKDPDGNAIYLNTAVGETV